MNDTGQTLAVRNPFSGEPVGEVPCSSVADVERLAEGMADRVDELPATARHDLLLAAATHLHEQRERFTALIVSESGICRSDAEREVQRAVENLRVAAAEAERLVGQTIPIPSRSAAASRVAMALWEPVGTVVAITPFNRPLNQVVVKVAPALAAGNRVIVKPSEKTPLTAFAFAQLLDEVGVPPGWVAVVAGPPGSIGPALCSSPAIDMVTFTGSVKTGRIVAGHAAGKKLLLELGGNDPLLVLDDADVDVAVELTLRGAFASAGQSCRGIKRVIAADSVATRLVSALAPRVAALRCGDPALADTDVGPLVDEHAAEVVLRRCAAAVAGGAVAVVGGSGSGALVAPTLLDRVDRRAELVVAETFGPVAPVIRVRDDDEAIAVANATEFGLQAGVVTNDAKRFTHIARRLRVGAVNLLEGPQFDSPFIPFGGVKASGVGREGIAFAMREMSVLKTVTMPW